MMTSSLDPTTQIAPYTLIFEENLSGSGKLRCGLVRPQRCRDGMGGSLKPAELVVTPVIAIWRERLHH